MSDVIAATATHQAKLSWPAEFRRRAFEALGRAWSWIRAEGGAPSEQPDLSKDELKEALRLNTEDLVKEVYEIAQRQMKTESERQGRLDSKANALLTTVGLSLTVLFTYGGLLIQHATTLRSEGSHLWTAAIVSLVLAVFTGITAGFNAILALLVERTSLTMNERTVFNVPTLRKADGADKPADGLAHYRRYLILDMWQITQAQTHNLERKARLIKRGQGCYMGFLLLLTLIGALMFAFALRSNGEDAAHGAPSAEGAPSAH